MLPYRTIVDTGYTYYTAIWIRKKNKIGYLSIVECFDKLQASSGSGESIPTREYVLVLQNRGAATTYIGYVITLRLIRADRWTSTIMGVTVKDGGSLLI